MGEPSPRAPLLDLENFSNVFAHNTCASPARRGEGALP